MRKRRHCVRIAIAAMPLTIFSFLVTGEAACGEGSSASHRVGRSSGGASTSQESAPGWFEFAIPGLDDSATPTNLAALNEVPAGADGFIRVRDGHFVDGQGRRIRFFGVNLTATACFPEPALAPRIAAHLRKLGFNVVRFHFMDVGQPPAGIFQRDGRTLDPGQLDRLDRLVAELKTQGIYTNLNLHVARRYPGLTEEAKRRFRLGKVLDRFYPPFLELQREYARDLLTHVNPYTGNAYAKEPAVLCVELNNENTMLPYWTGNVVDLPEPYGPELDRQWRTWLKERYETTDRLRAAWREGELPLGRELLANGDFRAGSAPWTIQAAGGAEAHVEPLAADLPPELTAGIRWHAVRAGTEGWHLQIFQGGLSITEGKAYTLSFWARAPQGAPGELEAVVMHAAEPWRNVGAQRIAALTRTWQHHSLLFHARGVNGVLARVNFSTRNQAGVVDLAGVSLREGGLTGLPEGATLENLAFRDAGRTPPARRDVFRFQMETEQAGTRGLVRFLKQDLGVRWLVTDTQADYGHAAGLLREAALSDYVDMHGYWQHPEFPGGNWDRSNWRIRNSTQAGAEDGGTLGHIAACRVAGMPLSVSEYNTPAPNDHAVESLPMLATIAAFQDWDAIYHYTYLDFKTDWESDQILSYFDLCGHAGQTAFAPAAAMLFRKALVQPGATPVTLTIPKDAIAGLLAEGRADIDDLWAAAGVPPGSVARRRLEVHLADGDGEVTSSEKIDGTSPRITDTGEITWEVGTAARPEGPALLVNAPAARLAIGKIVGRKIALGDAIVEVGAMELDYACLALVALDGKPLSESMSVLLTAAGRVENQGMGWNADRTSVSTAWGKGPTIAEVVPATVTLPGTGWRAQSLDGAGAPKADVPAVTEGGTTTATVGGTSPSLWYLFSR
ncbi:MAG: hypothetical protein FJ276_06275 [Planctomycetes bacterium]|nr:hypothetical protein [Planctomycetota bacterium]